MVLKADVVGVVHKTEAGAVVLGIDTRQRLLEEVRAMGKRFQGKKIAFCVQPQVSEGAEIIMGLKRVAGTGTLVMVGTGGIYTEILKDVQFRLCPITRWDAHNMIRSLKGYDILTGARGQKPVDVEKLEEILLRLSQLAMELEEVEELDFNPVFACAEKDKTMVADVRIKVSL